MAYVSLGGSFKDRGIGVIVDAVEEVCVVDYSFACVPNTITVGIDKLDPAIV